VLAPWVDGSLVSPEILRIESVRKQGLYAPLFESGVLLVDGTVASCYASPSRIDSSVLRLSSSLAGTAGVHAVAHTVCAPLRLYCLMVSLNAMALKDPEARPAVKAKNAARISDEFLAASGGQLIRKDGEEAQLARCGDSAKKRESKDGTFPIHPYAWTLYVLAASMAS